MVGVQLDVSPSGPEACALNGIPEARTDSRQLRWLGSHAVQLSSGGII